MNFCCIYLGSLLHRGPEPAPASSPASPPPDWGHYAKAQASIAISQEVSGTAGPLTIEPAWAHAQSRLLTVDEQDHLRDAVWAMQGHTRLAANKQYPDQLSGILSLSDGRTITYVYAVADSEWNGKDWTAPRDGHRPESASAPASRQIIKIAVARHGENLAKIDSNPVIDVLEGNENRVSIGDDRLPHLIEASNLRGGW